MEQSKNVDKGCEFCGAARVRLYGVNLGGIRRQMARCSGCGSCQVDSPIDEAEIETYYRDAYFGRAKWQVEKCEVLAGDYWRKIRRIVGSTNPGPILEVGAGYGFLAERLRISTGRRVDVVEPSDDCCAFIRDRFPELKIAGSSVNALVSGQEYAAVVCFHVLEHLQELTAWLRSVASLLQDGGRVVALTPNAMAGGFLKDPVRWLWVGADQHLQFLSPEIPNRYFEELGFRVTHCAATTPCYIHFPSRWLQELSDVGDGLEHGRGTVLDQVLPVKRLVRRLRMFARNRLQPNSSASWLLKVECCIDRLRGGQDRDELLLCLQREGSGSAERLRARCGGVNSKRNV